MSPRRAASTAGRVRLALAVTGLLLAGLTALAPPVLTASAANSVRARFRILKR